MTSNPGLGSPSKSHRKSHSLDSQTLCDDDERQSHSRPSSEISDGDHDILESEDERERLLINREGVVGMFGKPKVRIGSRRDSAGKSRQGKASSEEREALMYEMEEGVGKSDSSLSSGPSDESDERKLRATASLRKTRRKRIWRRMAIYTSIAVLFVVLLAVAYRVSKPKHKPSTATMMSNGTSLFAPTTLLISLDGFRADFLLRGLTPTLNSFIEEGISPKYMLPSFPSVTFPNHFTMATGLYPEAHGIVGNSFWDPSMNKDFYYTDPGRSMQSYWWGGEPLWATAERQDVKAAVHMWPGSEVPVEKFKPTYVDKYNGSEVLAEKVKRVLGLLDLPGPLDVAAKSDQPRPQLITAYVPNVDSDGHKFGPNSTEIRQTIKRVDNMLGSLLAGLQARNLTQIVNVVVVSDHGMATTDVSRLIQLEDLIDPNELERIDGWPLFGLRPKNPNDLDRLHKQLKEKAKGNPNIDVYLRDVDMPERYHFSNNDRIAPLWIVPQTGWAIVTKDEFDVEEGKKTGAVYHPRGLHGYDFEHPLMRAIFVARGPAFPHKPNSRVEPFQNIELYNIICDSVGISPAPNNGTLRLPLKPVGLHNDAESKPIEVPADPVKTSPVPENVASMTMPSLSSLVASASGLEDTMSSVRGPVLPLTTTTSTPPANTNEAGQEEEEESWWDWFKHKAEHVGEWVDGIFHKRPQDPKEP